MGKDTATAANKNRRIRQEALREQLAAQGHVQHAAEIINNLRDESKDIDPGMVNRYRIALDGHMRFVNKYLPDLKAQDIDITNEDGSLKMPAVIKLVAPTD